MTEHLTPREAANVLAEASRFEASLQQRTEGITAMVWGAVGPGIYLSYRVAGTSAGFPDWAFAFLWAPWILAGALTTFALWRSAALSFQSLPEPLTPLGYLWRFLAISAAAIVVITFWNPDHYGAPLLIIGGLYLVLGGWNPYRMSRRGRAAALFAGFAFLAVAAFALSRPQTGLGFTLVVFVAGFVPLFAGFWQTITS